MSKMGWSVWIVALGTWGLFCCWHCGYQSGYADGHETAMQMYQEFTPVYQLVARPDNAGERDLDETAVADDRP